MRKVPVAIVIVYFFLGCTGWAFAQQQIGFDPVAGPICAGPLGPAPCQVIQRYLQMQQQAAQLPPLTPTGFLPGIGPICQGPLGPGPCAAVQQYILMQQQAPPLQLPVIANQPGVRLICAGPLCPGPCAAIQQYIINQRAGSQPPPQIDWDQIRVLSNSDGAIGPICNGPLAPAPCGLVQQYLLDQSTGNAPSQEKVELSPSLSSQELAQKCAQRAGFDVTAFAGCVGQMLWSEN